jgi:hypothetical protein
LSESSADTFCVPDSSVSPVNQKQTSKQLDNIYMCT